MKPLLEVTLMSAEYVSDYKFRFAFSDKTVSVVDFKRFIKHQESLHKFLDLERFKKIKIHKAHCNIYWGRNWDMNFHVWEIYNETEIIPCKPFNPHMSFKERARLGMEALANQPPVSFEQVKAQVRRLKARSTAKNKKIM
jgi:hypothetical protein